MDQVTKLFEEINKNPLLVTILMIWTIVWKGLALWKAAGKKDKIWFAVLLVLNTLGLVEILYYFFLSKKPILLQKLGLRRQKD